jgi:hypothetical protein
MGLRYLPAYDAYVQWPVMLGAVAAYLASIVVLRQWMQGRDKFVVSAFTKVYNATQIVLCGYMLWGFALSSVDVANPFGLNQPFDAATEWFMFVHYASKYLDFFDTWIMILKKNDRQLSFLHVYHHASILLVWGYLLQLGQASGTAYFGAAINSLIHLIMYSHYLYTSFGLVNPFKAVVTQCQIAQFYLCLTHAALAVAFETVLNARLAWIQLAYHVSMLVLFTDFQRKTYGDAKKAAKEAKENGHSNGGPHVPAATSTATRSGTYAPARWGRGQAGATRSHGCMDWQGHGRARRRRPPHSE